MFPPCFLAEPNTPQPTRDKPLAAYFAVNCPSSMTDALSPAARSAPAVSIVVPCCNEEQSLPRLASALIGLRGQLCGQYELEFVLVDDGSTDRTWECLRAEFGGQPHVKLVQHPTNRGIAAAIATGIERASAETIASLDADCTYDPRQLAELLPLLTDGVDLVVASPYHPRGAVENVPAWRLAISKLASRMYRLVLRNKLHTYTSCFRVYRRSAVIDLPLRNDGFVGIAELVWRLDAQGATIVECPAVLSVRRSGRSKLKIVRATLGHLRLLCRAASGRFLRRTQPPATSPFTRSEISEGTVA